MTLDRLNVTFQRQVCYHGVKVNKSTSLFNVHSLLLWCEYSIFRTHPLLCFHNKYHNTLFFWIHVLNVCLLCLYMGPNRDILPTYRDVIYFCCLLILILLLPLVLQIKNILGSLVSYIVLLYCFLYFIVLFLTLYLLSSHFSF